MKNISKLEEYAKSPERGLDLQKALDATVEHVDGVSVPIETLEIADRPRGRMTPSPNTPLTKCPHNIDLSTMEGKSLLFAAENPADIVIDENHKDAQGRPYIVINVIHYLIYPDEFVDPDTGEVKQGSRTVLITHDYLTYKTSSSHAPHRLAAACDMFTEQDWKRGIKFRITERKSRNPKRQSPYHDIRLEL